MGIRSVPRKEYSVLNSSCFTWRMFVYTHILFRLLPMSHPVFVASFHRNADGLSDADKALCHALSTAPVWYAKNPTCPLCHAGQQCVTQRGSRAVSVTRDTVGLTMLGVKHSSGSLNVHTVRENTDVSVRIATYSAILDSHSQQFELDAPACAPT